MPPLDGDRRPRKGPPGWLIRQANWLVRRHLSNATWSEPPPPDADAEGFARLTSAMDSLRRESPAQRLFSEANARALRWADPRTRTSDEARILLTYDPAPPGRLRRMARAIGRVFRRCAGAWRRDPTR